MHDIIVHVYMHSCIYIRPVCTHEILKVKSVVMRAFMNKHLLCQVGVRALDNDWFAVIDY